MPKCHARQFDTAAIIVICEKLIRYRKKPIIQTKEPDPDLAALSSLFLRSFLLLPLPGRFVQVFFVSLHYFFFHDTRIPAAFHVLAPSRTRNKMRIQNFAASSKPPPRLIAGRETAHEN